MKNLINYLKTLWGAWGNLQSKDVRHDCRLTVGSPSGMTAKLQVNSFMRFAVVLTLIFTIGSGNVWGADKWVKVTSEPVSWEGEYLLVYESSSTSGYVWTGVDGTSCYASATISSGEISSIPSGGTSLTIAAMTDGYSIKINSGTNKDKYIGKSSYANGMDIAATAAVNTLEYNSSEVTITGSGGCTIRYNNASGQYRFRYYKSGQQAVQLYKKTSSGVSTPTLTCATTSLSFEAAVDGTDTKNFTFSGSNLTANAGLAISGTNAGMFSVSPTSVNKGSGTITDQSVTVTYSPTAVGSHSATLTISSTDASDKTITLSGTATAPSVPHTVTFNAGTGSCGTSSLTEASAGAGVELPAATHACPGWSFAGWATASVATSTSVKPTLYAAGDTYHPAGNETLYAVYKQASGPGSEYTDELNLTLTGVTAGTTSYTAWSDIAATNSGHSSAVYAGQSAGGNSSIQIRATSPSGIITTTSGGTAQKVTISWNTNTAAGRTITVYGKNTAYSATSDLHNDATKGTELGTIVKGTSTELDITGSYAYIGLLASDPMYLDQIDIKWSTISYNYHSVPTCVGASLSVTPTTYNYGTWGIDAETEATFTVTGINLTANATLALSGANSGMFILSTATLEKDGSGRIGDADNVTVIYHPTASGTHTATLTISSTGASDATVTLNGKCELVCSTPTVSFTDGETIYKYQGDAPFTNLAIVNGNGLGATVTYSSSNTSLATVNATTGEVTIVNATTGDAVRITASVVAKENDTHTACQNATSRYYNLIIKNRITWQVNNEDYVEGDPTTSVYEDGAITTLPTAPDGSTICGGKTFVGWTDAAGGSYVHGTSNLYKAVGDFPSISENKIFYAVFATSGGTEEATKSVTISTYATAHSWADQTKYTSVTIDENITATVSGGGNDGKYYTNGTNWRFYQTSGGTITLSAGSGCTLKSVTFTYSVENTGILKDGTTDVTSGGAYSISGTSKSFTVGNTGSATNGQVRITVISVTYEKSSYSDYTTECGVCLKAPNPITVTATRTSATLSWKAVADATGYEVTCAQGGTPIDPANITVDGTTATISGLSATTTYTYSVRSIGSEETYDCFPPQNGSFTTPDCDDVPVIGTTTVTALTATLVWTCSAATSTIKLYSDAACTQNETVFASKTSPAELTGLVSDSTYYFKIFAGGTCASQVGSFKTEDVALDVSEWREDAVVITYNGEADLTLTTYNEVTHGSKDAHVATELFFSKYFEAAAGVKMLAIYNGTLESKDLSSYKLCIAQNQKAFKETAFSSFVKKDGNSLTAAEKILEPNEEVIFISFEENANSGNDTTIIACARDNDEQSGYSSYIRIKTPELAFNGDDVIGLKNPSGSFIDMIGPQNHNLTNFTSCSGVGGSGCDFMDNPGGWYNEHGYYANPDGTEAPNYALSTNRCLLIRRKHVTSGDSAVARNLDDFVTLGDYIYAGEPHEGEWKGVQIPGTTTPEPGQERKDVPGIKAACEGFEEVGGYDYNDYYTSYETFGTPQTFEDLKSNTNPWDGTYIIPVDRLDTMACTKVRIELANDEDKVVIRKDLQVPIMVYGDKQTNDAIFNNYHKGPDVCKTCDVVIMNNASLTKYNGSAPSTDAVEVRNVKVYHGGKLVVPDETNYTVNSLALRRQEDEISMADIKGTLNVNKSDGKGVYLDLRIDPSQWHFVALPFDCNVADIAFSDGTPAVHREDFFIKWYNGASRAANKDGGWETYTGTTLKKGLGYRIGLAGSGVVKRELRFPMSNDVIDDEQEDKIVGNVYAYGGDKSDEQLTPNHKGWNLIGNPYLMYYATDITTPLGFDELVPDGNTYKRKETGLRYLVEPINNGAGGYRQIAISTHMPPFTSYFVQIGTAANKTGGDNPSTPYTITFNQSSSGKASIVRRRMPTEVTEDNHIVWYGIELVAPNAEKDQTVLLISNDFTDEYDMMDDLIKMRGSKYTRYNMPILASRNNEGEMAFNALPDNSAIAGIPINYYAAQTGTYTIRTDSRYNLEEIKSAMLFDKTTNQYYNLLDNDYVFDAAKGNNTDRFTLFVRVERKKAPEVATGCDNLLDGQLSLIAIDRTLVLSGLTEDADIYVYDMSGKLVRGERANGNGIWRATVPATGVYFVRVNSAGGQQTLRTIVK